MTHGRDNAERDRLICEAIARGELRNCVARRFDVSPQRVTQIAHQNSIGVDDEWRGGDARQMEHDSRNFLKALLKYGIRHNSDLAMGNAAFRARCGELGIVLR